MPPGDACLLGQPRALGDELVRPGFVAGVALDRSQRADGLRESPDVVLPLVNLVALLDELACLLEPTNDVAVLRQRCRVALRAELMEELGGALDVREEERDSAVWKIVPHARIIRGSRSSDNPVRWGSAAARVMSRNSQDLMAKVCKRESRVPISLAAIFGNCVVTCG